MKKMLDLLGKIFFKLIDYQKSDKTSKIWGFSVILILIALGGLLVYLTGGTKNAFLHVLYVPIILASFMFGIPGGLLTGIIAGLVVGPLMPQDVINQNPQQTLGWVYRLSFFIFIGLSTGILAHLYNVLITLLHSLVNETSNNYCNILKSLAKIVEKRDEQTAGHCYRVANNAYLVGEKMGLPKKELNLLYWAGLLHDLGKIGVPIEILNKPGKLSDDEFDQIKQHTTYGFELLKAMDPDFKTIAVGVKHHHEKWDGTGYPDRLKKRAIPLTGRILSVVDVFEALTSHRPYRSPLDENEAMQYLEDNAESSFDPEVVTAFYQLFNNGKLYIEDTPEEELEIENPADFSLEKIWASFVNKNPLGLTFIKNPPLLKNIAEEMHN